MLGIATFSVMAVIVLTFQCLLFVLKISSDFVHAIHPRLSIKATHEWYNIVYHHFHAPVLAFSLMAWIWRNLILNQFRDQTFYVSVFVSTLLLSCTTGCCSCSSIVKEEIFCCQTSCSICAFCYWTFNFRNLFYLRG